MSDTKLISMSYEPGAAQPPGSVPLCVPELRGNEWDYVKQCLDTNWVSSAGQFVERFEEGVANFVGAKNGIATVSGTAALHVALLLAGVRPDDEVVIPALTFIAPANAIRYAGAWPVFMDVEPDYWQMDVQKLSDFLHSECRWSNGTLRNASNGRHIKAILPVHILGHPCDMDPINELARKFELRVIEDATESLGAKYKEQMVGNLSDIGCFSFNGNKVITTGGGGMIVTNNDEWAARARYLTTQAKDDPIEYVHNEVGFNYRLTNIQAAVGCAQMEYLESFVARKREIASTYAEQFESVPGIRFMKEAKWAFSAFWMSTICVEESEYGLDSRNLLNVLASHKIQARPLWQPLHLSQAHADSQSCGGEIAERINRQALSLPSSVGLTTQDQHRVIEVIRKGKSESQVNGSK